MSDKCRTKHQGGCLIQECQGYAITDYTTYYKDLMIHKAIFTLYRDFKFCPFCGKEIDLPKWMGETDEEWTKRFGHVSNNMKTREELKLEDCQSGNGQVC